jgi:hypothetical protein
LKDGRIPYYLRFVAMLKHPNGPFACKFVAMLKHPHAEGSVRISQKILTEWRKWKGSVRISQENFNRMEKVEENKSWIYQS